MLFIGWLCWNHLAWAEPATITYTKHPQGYKRDVMIDGLRVSDEGLALRLNHQPTLDKIYLEQFHYRLWWGSVGGASLGGGIVLLGFLNQQPQANNSNNSLLLVNQQVYVNSPQNTLLLLGGTLLTAIGTYATVQFLSDTLGFTDRAILTDEEVKALVQEYNRRQLTQSYIHDSWPVLQFSQRF